MKILFFFCISSTLVCAGFTRRITSHQDEKKSQWSQKGIEKLKFSTQYIPKLREPANHRWKSICNPPLVYYKNSCYEAYKQGPCQRESYIFPSIEEELPQCVKNPCKKDGWVFYNGICQALKSQGPCAANQVIGVDKTTLKIECIPISDSANQWRDDLYAEIIRSIGDHIVYNSIAQVPIRRTTPQPACPPGSYKNKSGECRRPMSTYFS